MFNYSEIKLNSVNVDVQRLEIGMIRWLVVIVIGYIRCWLLFMWKVIWFVEFSINVLVVFYIDWLK